MKKIIFLALIFFLSGCYNYRELNDLAIVKGAAIDISGNEYVLSYIVSDNAKDKETTDFILEGRGKTISDAVSEINLSSPKELYIGHMLIYVISENVARNGISDVTDYFFRNPESKKTFQVFISKGIKATDVLKSLLSLEKTDNIVKNLISENSLSSFFINTSLLSLLKEIKDPGIEASLNGITIITNKQNEKHLKIEPLALFKDDKLIKWSDKETGKGIAILFNQTNSSKIDVKCGSKHVVFSLNDLKVKKKFKIDKTVNFEITVEANTEIEEMTCSYDVKNEKDLKILEDLLTNKIKNMLENTIIKIKSSKIDSIGLGYYIYQNDYKNWLIIKNNYLENLNVNFKIIPNLLALKNTNEGTVKIGK